MPPPPKPATSPAAYRPGQRLAVGAEHAAGQVGVQAAERLAREDVQADRDQRAGLRVEDPVRRGDARDPVRQVAPRAADRGDLQVLRVGVLDLAVARDDLALDVGQIEQRLVGQRVHPAHERGEVALDDEVGAVLLERLDRAGRALADAGLQDLDDALARQVGVLLGARERELLLDDLLRQHEPRVVVAGLHDVLERAERVEAREQRHRQPRAGRVQPQRGGPGQDADAVRGPDRVPVRGSPRRSATSGRG